MEEKTRATTDALSGGPAHPRRRLRFAVRLLIGLGVLGLTAWNLTRSSALETARRSDARRDFRTALQYALDHLDRRPWSREAALLAARGFSRLNDPNRAEPYYRRAGPLSIDDLHLRAHHLLRGESYEQAIRVYQELLARRPDDRVALRRLAAARLAQGNPGEVLKLADRLERQPGGAVIADTLRGVVHHDNKEALQASAAFERVLALDPELREMPLPRWLFWSHLADDLVVLGRSHDARTLLARAVAEAPDARLMCLLGRVYQFEGERDAAERCLRQSAEWDPRYDLPRLYLGQIAAQQGRLEEARTLLHQAWDLAPRRYETAYNLALTYGRLGPAAAAARWRHKAETLRAGAAPPVGSGLALPEKKNGAPGAENH